MVRIFSHGGRPRADSRCLSAVVVALALVVATLVFVPTSAAAAPPAPTNVTFTIDATGTRGHLEWTQPPGEAAPRHDVTLLDNAGAIVGKAARCYGCTSYTFTGLLHGQRYRATVVPIGAGGGAGPAVTAPTTSLLADQSACRNTGAEGCVTVDATTSLGPITHNAAGLLSAQDAPDQYLDIVAPTWWRYGWDPSDPGFSAIVPDKAATYGAKVINVLAFGWFQTTKDANGNAAPPWAGDYAAWETYVRNQVIDLRNSGKLPDYWEVWNEPGGNVPPLAPDQQFTQERQLELYARTYNVIKSEEPTAKVAAYAVVGFWGHAANRDVNGIPRQVSLDELLPFLEENQLGLDLLTWHEIVRWNHYDTNKYADLNLERHVEKAREMLADHGFADVPIQIDEYLDASVQHMAAWNLGTIAAIERTGIAGGVRTCWPNIPNPVPAFWRPTVDGCYGWEMMDNLLTGFEEGFLGQGAHPTQPRPALWVYDAYRQMTGNRVVSTASFDRLVHLASRDGDRIAVMVGRRESCTTGQNPLCPAGEPESPGPTPERVFVEVPTDGTYNVVATKFRGGYYNAQLAPDVATGVPAQASTVNGMLTIPIAAIADGEVFHLVITPA